MRTPPEIATVTDTLLDTLKAKGGTSRMLSSTFWWKFRFERRSPERVADVKAALAQRDIQILHPATDQFGSEPPDAWVQLSLGAVQMGKLVPGRPREAWFVEMTNQRFESEAEVGSFFVLPILTELDYNKADIAQGYSFEFAEGSRHRRAEADFALFDGTSRDPNAALLLIETKASGKLLTRDHEAQARSYAIWLCAPYYMVTNGDELVILENLGAPEKPVEILRMRRDELRLRWKELAAKLNKKAVVARKAQIAETLKRARA
jgi:hypothetical protein